MSRLTGLMPAPAKALMALVVLWALMMAAVVVVVGFGAVR